MIKDYKRKIIMLKNAMRFMIELIFLCGVYFFWCIIYNEAEGVHFSEGIFNTCFMLYVYFRLVALLGKCRKTADEGGYELKGLYTVYILFLLSIICCSYNLDTLKSMFVSMNLNEYVIMGGYSIYWILSTVYKAIQIIQTSIEVALVKDVVFEINGWNISKTIEAYWDELIENQKLYILHEDQHKKIPRLWVIRGDSSADVIDYSQEAMIHHSSKEYIELTDVHAKEVLRRRKIDDNDQCCYEGDSAWILTPWKTEHFYAVNFIMIDLDYYKENKIEELIQKNRDKILLLPSDIKAKERKIIKRIVSCKNKVERKIMGAID